MPLSRQIIIIILLLFILLFIGTLSVSIGNTRDYLNNQLESHAQDTASSLGLSLTPHMAKADIPMMTSMVDAIFDRGYYREIKLLAIDGSVILQRIHKVKIEGVPPWFVDLIPLETPEGLSTVSAQWSQAARIHVQSHPGYAYLDLWHNTVETFWWFLLSFVIGALVFIFLLKIILTPLSQVEEQALAITRREFPVVSKLPWTRELRRVVIAMNKMSSKIKAMISEQMETIERVRKEAYIDELTGMANRRSFDMQLEHIVMTTNEITQGAVFLVRINGLTEINNARGYLEGDEFIRNAANVIRRCTLMTSHAFVARIAGVEFGLILPGAELEECRELAREMAAQLPLIEEDINHDGICHIGAAWYSGQTDSKSLLSRADMALRSIMQQPNAWQVHSIDDRAGSVVHGAQDWREILENAIHENSFSFYRQPVFSLGAREKLHYEVFSRLMAADKKEIPAMTFMPMAERLGLMPILDKHLVSQLVDFLGRADNAETGSSYAVNLSPSSIHDTDFMEWLYGILSQHSAIAARIIIETPEHAAITDIAVYRKVVQRLHDLGCRCSLDHFGASFAAFGYLYDLKLDIIKIHGRLVRNIAENKDNHFFVQSLTQIAHGLDIEVIGEYVESESDRQELSEIGLNGGQGYYMGGLEQML